MPQTQSQEKAGSLEALAQAQFPYREFTAAERKLLASAPKGKVAVCGPNSDPKDPANDPSKAERSEGNRGWGREREIGADLIRWLCTDHRAKELVDPSGVHIQGAKITGELRLDYAIVPFPISLARCALTEDASLVLVEIPQIDLEGAWTKSIDADHAIVKGGVFLVNGFHADGEVRWLGARIGGSLECGGGTFNNPGGYALSADRAIVNGGVFLQNGFHAHGKVRWPGAQIGGDLYCDGGTFDSPRGDALNVENAGVKGNLFLSGEFSAQGEVSLLGAQIGGDLECTGGTFHNPEGVALNVEHTVVKGNVFLRNGFGAQGTVSLMDAHIEGRLDCTRAALKEATLDLRDAKAYYLQDDHDHWPQSGKLLLDGLVYGRFVDAPKDYRTRLEWLALQPEKPFATQPYLQLAKVLREAGDNDGAVNVLEEMEHRRRRQADQGRLDRQAISWLFREFAGYGYDPVRSVGAIAALSGLGWILYRRSYLMGGMVPIR